MHPQSWSFLHTLIYYNQSMHIIYVHHRYSMDLYAGSDSYVHIADRYNIVRFNQWLNGVWQSEVPLTFSFVGSYKQMHVISCVFEETYVKVGYILLFCSSPINDEYAWGLFNGATCLNSRWKSLQVTLNQANHN